MEDRVRLTADDSDYQAVMRRAGSTADQFTSRIQKAHTGFTGMFKRSPDMRAERAMSGFVERIVQGDVAGGIAQISSRMTGLGLVAGVAIIAGVEVFKKFKEQIDATREAHSALQMEMLKRPLSTVTSLSSEGMEQALQTREKLATDLRTKSEHTFGSEIFEAGQSLLNMPGANFAAGAGKERIQEQKTLNEETMESKKIMAAQAALAMTLLGIRRQELTGDERQAEIAKIILLAEQQRAALKGKGLTAKAFNAADEAISENAELSITQLNKKAALTEGRLKMEEKIAKLQHEGLTGADLKKTRTALELQSLDQQIAGEASPEKKRELQLQRLQKSNELRGLSPRSASANPFPSGSIAGRGFESEYGYQGFTKRHVEDSLGFGGLARRSMENGESLTPEEALLKTKSASAEEIAGYKKNVGNLPGAESSEAVGLLTEIKNIIDEA
jgi:hypothetical protein